MAKNCTLVCKRQAPWPLFDKTEVLDNGEIKLQQSHAYLNNYCPSILLAVRCNNDIKMLTNPKETRSSMWYATGYQTKKQGKTYNLSALMVKALMYHQGNSAYLADIQERNRLLVFRCFNVLNRQAEQSGPQVISYLMGWGDTICSHRYVPVYWSALEKALKKAHPILGRSDQNVDQKAVQELCQDMVSDLISGDMS
jgi:hypothetical protein